uniref:Uncharacterized protein n=1 Tax=Rhizophora mucronata TaxID=61149 RepID=A0A2P2R4J4_RHIMU
MHKEYRHQYGHCLWRNNHSHLLSSRIGNPCFPFAMIQHLLVAPIPHKRQWLVFGDHQSSYL